MDSLRLQIHPGSPDKDSLQLQSPDGKTLFRLSTTPAGELRYTVSRAEKEVMLPSSLGLEGWRNGLSLRSVVTTQKDTTWAPVYGERKLIRDHYSARTYTFFKGNNERACLQIEVRAYNEGIAFRYRFPEHPSGGSDITISKDLTEFTLPAGTNAWFTDHAQGSYRLLPLENWPSEAERPLTLQLQNGLFVALAEAEVVDYCRTRFALQTTKPNTIACAMYDKVELTTPFTTPWRVIMVAEAATQLLQNNDLILNLNPPCAIQNTSWIKPGKIIREVTLSTAGAKQTVDFAVKRHLQYIHFDAGWYGYEYVSASDASAVNVDPRRNPRNDLDLQEVIRYAKEKGIGVWLYVNQRALARQLDTLLPLYEKWGVAGLKFGFVHVGSHRWTTWLHEAVRKCAQHHLMVDIHDEYRPTGFSRTYPNLLTQEGVRGNEEMPDANNNTTLPFTRFLCGHADYTICYYHRPELKPKLAETQNTHVLKTTSAHQLALSVVYYSPLQFLYWYDKPEDSQDEPELAFFDHIPTVWTDTRILDGRIGEFITVARQSGNGRNNDGRNTNGRRNDGHNNEGRNNDEQNDNGQNNDGGKNDERSNDDWFVGSITNNEARDIQVNFSFLPPGKKFTARIYYDDPASPVRTKVSIRSQVVDASSIIKTHLPASGGQAIWISPIDK